MSSAGGDGESTARDAGGELVETVGPEVATADDRTTVRERADDVIAAFEKPRRGRSPLSAQGRFLPGLGEGEQFSEYQDCGDEIPRFCADCGNVAMVGRTCYRASCPRCAASWCRRRGAAIAAKLDAARKYLYASTPPSVVPKFHHLVMSPPQGVGEWRLLAEDPHDRTFECVGDAMEALGIQGVVFEHPFRGEDGDDRGAWKDRMFSGRPWLDLLDVDDSVAPELEFSPHFHIIGVAAEVDMRVTPYVEEETGWTIHRIQNDDTGISVRDDYAMARAVTYCLSHTGLRETESGNMTACYRYFGADMNRVTAQEDAEAEMNAIVRSVAPETLGLDYKGLACHNERSERAEYRVSTGLASASRLDPAGDSGGAGGEQGDEWDDGEVDLVRPERATTTDDPDAAQAVQCEGRMLNIMAAPKFLDDPDWREHAACAAETERAYQTYVEGTEGDGVS